MNLLSKTALAAGMLSLSASLLFPAEQQFVETSRLGSGDIRRALTVRNLERSYLVHVPDSYDGSKAFPVVLVFRGGGSNARQWVAFCGLNETSDREGFIAVYPNGTGRTIENLPDKVEDGTTVIREYYGGGKDGSEMVLVMIKGGGHSWPGREFDPKRKVLGTSTKDISANDIMWEFFKKHPMK